jgi:hypothetical protein
MDDIFNSVERLIQGSLSLLYNTLYSVAVLLRHPVRGPLRLNMRHIRSATQQLGPSTLLFLVFFLVGGLLPFSRGGDVIPTSSADLRSFDEIVQAISDQGFVAFFLVSIAFALVAASCIDLISRVLFWFFFKRYYIDPKSHLRVHVSANRRQIIFARYQYAIVLGLIFQIFASVISGLILFNLPIASGLGGFVLMLFLLVVVIFVSSLFVFWPCASMLRRHGPGRLIYGLPIVLGMLSFLPWAAAAWVTSALLNRDDGFKFVDEGGCTSAPSTETTCSFALYNGGDHDIIVDGHSVTLFFSYKDGPTLTLMQATTGSQASKKTLRSDALKKSFLVVEKGKTAVVDLSPGGSDWQDWAQKAGAASISAKLTVSYEVLGEPTPASKTIDSGPRDFNFTTP